MEDIYTIQSIQSLEEWYDELDRAFEENKDWLEEFYRTEVQSEGRIYINTTKYYK
jgi:ribosomal protein S17E